MTDKMKVAHAELLGLIILITIYYLLHVDDYQYDVATKHTERKYKYGQSGYKYII